MTTLKRLKVRRSIAIIVCLLIFPIISFAQNETSATSYFSNALFNTLIIIVILLTILIVALGTVLKNITGSEMFIEKLKNAKEQKAGSKATSILFLLTFLSYSAYAGNPAKADNSIGGIDQGTFYTLLSLILIEIIIVITLLQTILKFIRPEETKLKEIIAEPRRITILNKLTDAVEVEKEDMILLDHDYDGIKELDNNLPPWWKYGFYLTIFFAVVYMINFHVTATSPLQAEEYKLSIKKAEQEVAEYMKNSANNVDESNVKMLTDQTDLASGKEIFISACSACHGKYGEGTVGPNLTDDYWLHSGSVKDIFKTIKYGYPDKGMKAWKDDYSPKQIAQLTSYIKTLRGTNPLKQKEKQGELYVEENTAPVDSTQTTPGDSIQPPLLSDTLKAKK